MAAARRARLSGFNRWHAGPLAPLGGRGPLAAQQALQFLLFGLVQGRVTSVPRHAL